MSEETQGRRVLRTLFSQCPTGFLRLLTFDANKENPRNYHFDLSRLDEADALLSTVGDTRNVFFGVGATAEDLGRAAIPEDITVLPALFLDFDTTKNVGDGRPQTKEEIVEFLEALELPPSVITDSGHGIHAFWVLSEPIMVGDFGLEAVFQFWTEFWASVSLLGQRDRGWPALDKPVAMTQFARLPGSFNLKAGGKDPCRVISVTERRFALGEIDAFTAKYRPAEDIAPPRSVKSKTPDWLTEADRDWWIKWLLATAPRSRSAFPDPNPKSLVVGCDFVRHVIDDAVMLSEPHWLAGIGLFSRCENGDAVAHAISEPYPRYAAGETQNKIDYAKKLSGPTTCAHIANRLGYAGCAACPFKTKVTTPLQLGDRPSQLIPFLEHWAYSAGTDEFFDLSQEDLRSGGLKPDRFGRRYAHLGIKRIEEVCLKDKLLTKVDERDYRPELATGAFVEGGKAKLNIYRPPVFDCVPGSPIAFIKHLRYLIPKKVERRLFIHVLAHLAQHPERKIKYAPVLVGLPGNGKSFLHALAQPVFGKTNVKTTQGFTLNNRFNGHLASGVVQFIEEANTGDRREITERLKTTITEQFDSFERKNRDIEMLPTPKVLIFFTNNHDGIYIDPHDRRFFVIDTAKEPHPGGAAYYDNLFKISEATAAGVRDLLLKINLSNFNPNVRPPMTAAKLAMIEARIPDIDLFIRESLEDQVGIFANDLLIWPEIEAFVREKFSQREVSIKRIRRALDVAGVVYDGERQVRLDTRICGYDRVRFWIVRDHQRYLDMSMDEVREAFLSERRGPPAPQIEAIRNRVRLVGQG